MIIGVGTDCCEIKRMEAALHGPGGSRFLERVLSDAEREQAAKRPEAAAYFAKRFAAKEACAKALGTGITGKISWHDVEVLNAPSGQPLLRLSGGALQRLGELIPAGQEAVMHISLADDPPMALAFVVLEARPRVTST